MFLIHHWNFGLKCVLNGKGILYSGTRVVGSKSIPLPETPFQLGYGFTGKNRVRQQMDWEW